MDVVKDTRRRSLSDVGVLGRTLKRIATHLRLFIPSQSTRQKYNAPSFLEVIRYEPLPLKRLSHSVSTLQHLQKL
jgi:hypothetical protein